METLDVYLNDIKAGRLYDDNGEMSFVYDEQYIGFSGNKTVNYSVRIVVSWLRWHWHFGWYEGNDDKAPF